MTTVGVGYYAVHRETGKFFVGKAMQIAYVELNILKSMIKYWYKDENDYNFYKLTSNGKTELVG